MQDKRLTHRLTEYWNLLRADAPLPDWNAFDPAAFNDIWKQCCGLKIDFDEGDAIVYTYEYVGNSIEPITTTGLKGKRHTSRIEESTKSRLPGEMLSSHFKNFPAARILQKIDRIVKRPSIMIEEGRAIDEQSGKNIRFRSCMLPFGTQEGKVTHMVLGFSWKAY